MPRMQLERLEKFLQKHGIVHVGRNKTDRMLGSSGKRRRGGCVLARQMIENDRFADIRAADNGNHQKRRQIELRQKTVRKQLEPLFATRSSNANRRGNRLHRIQRLMQPPNSTRERFIVGRHRKRVYQWSVYSGQFTVTSLP